VFFEPSRSDRGLSGPRLEVNWPAALAPWVQPLRCMPLGPGTPDPAARPRIAALLAQVDLPQVAQAGLWLLHDFWEPAHELVQDDPSPEGSYWHAILHRREPDAFNARYWFRKVRTHPVQEWIATHAATLGYPGYRAETFLDDIETHRDQGTPQEALFKTIQQLEWWLLFDWCSQLGR